MDTSSRITLLNACKKNVLNEFFSTSFELNKNEFHVEAYDFLNNKKYTKKLENDFLNKFKTELKVNKNSKDVISYNDILRLDSVLNFRIKKADNILNLYLGYKNNKTKLEDCLNKALKEQAMTTTFFVDIFVDNYKRKLIIGFDLLTSIDMDLSEDEVFTAIKNKFIDSEIPLEIIGIDFPNSSIKCEIKKLKEVYNDLMNLNKLVYSLI